MNKKFFAVLGVVALVVLLGAGCSVKFGEEEQNANVLAPEEVLDLDNENVNVLVEEEVSDSGDRELDLPPGWETFDEGGIKFSYPKDLGTNYIEAHGWPPEVMMATGEFSCAETPAESSLPEREVARRTVNGRVYCIRAESEAAAGSVYTTYTYSTPREGDIISLNFVLRYPNCLNYDEPKKSECQAERETFNLDELIDQIVETVEIE